MSAPSALPYPIDPTQDDAELVALIDAWRVRSDPIGWDAIVGHEPQIRRCRELVEMLTRPEDELARLGLRVGRGLCIVGPAGVGKSLLARAMAGAIGREVIAPPVAELTPALIARLYAQLGRMPPTVVLLDEAERVMGIGYLADEDCVRALCVALDGIERPSTAPITIALTTAHQSELSPVATRAGRLAPRLVLGAPTREDRVALFAKAIHGLPTTGPIDVDRLAERTAGWSGSEIFGAVVESMSHSLIEAEAENRDKLRMATLLAKVGEHFVIEDDSSGVRAANREAAARHEAAHAIWAHLRWGPGSVALITLKGETHGTTRIDEDLFLRLSTVGGLTALAGMSLAGMVGERLAGGRDAVTLGATVDRAKATQLLKSAREATRPYDPDVFEMGQMSDRGSEHIRATWQVGIEEEASQLLMDVTATLAPHRGTIRVLAEEILSADEMTLSGDDLAAAIKQAFAPWETGASRP